MSEPGQGMLEAALALWELGFHIIPLGSPFEPPPQYMITRHGSAEEAALQWPKVPRIEWRKYQHHAPTEAEVREWWTKWPTANIAIVTGPQIHVVDADSQEAAAWCESGAITRTPWRVKTGRGMQYYYKASELDVRNTVNERAKLDTRGTGGYVVAPGSTHSSGHVYAWIKDDGYDAQTPDDLPPLTAEDLAAIRFCGIGQTIDAAGGFSIDLRGVPLKATGAPVAEGGRNNAAASLAGQFINQGMNLRDIKSALDAWNASNPAPLPQDELNTTLASVVRTHTDKHPDQPVLCEPITAQANMTPAGPAPQTTPTTGRHGFSLYSVGELIDTPPKKPESLWNGATLFKGARVLVAADPKVGKSRFAMAWAKALATGAPFLEVETIRQVKSCYFNAEIHEAWLPDRLRPMIRNTDEEDMASLRENLLITGRLHLDIMNPVDNNLIRMALAHTRPEVSVFDPAIDLSSASENDNTEIRAMLREYDKLAHDFNMAVILIHHTRKKGQGKQFDSGPFDRIRGASAFRGWYDTGIVLTPTGGANGEVTVAFELRNGESLPSVNMFWHEGSGQYKASVNMAPEDARPDPQPEATRTGEAARSWQAFHAMEPGHIYTPSELRQWVMEKCLVGQSSAKTTLIALRTYPAVRYIDDGNKSTYQRLSDEYGEVISES